MRQQFPARIVTSISPISKFSGTLKTPHPRPLLHRSTKRQPASPVSSTTRNFNSLPALLDKHQFLIPKTTREL